MKAETFILAILQKMTGTGKVQRKFLVHIIGLLLSIRGRFNYLSMARYGIYNHLSYRLNFSKFFDFKSFNKEIISTYCGSEKVFLFDPSYISKSGKHTPGVGYFWSGCSGSMNWGMELSTLAVGDIENHTALHYHSVRTIFVKGEESLRSYYANIITKQASELHKTSKVIVFDAFFSKKDFVDAICKADFTLVSRLQRNVYLRYKFIGEQKKGSGRKKEFGEKVDLKNLSSNHFTLLEIKDDERIYEGIVHVRSLKRWCKVVVVQIIKEDKVHKTLVYFSTDSKMLGQKVLQYYRLRYQIEFLFRDSKGFLGLEHTQSRKEKALDFHYNLSLSTLNVAKAMHWLTIPKESRGPFSIADIKTQYCNQFLLDKLITIYGKDPLVEINNPQIREIYQLGRIAA
jgi:hypothetical protein